LPFWHLSPVVSSPQLCGGHCLSKNSKLKDADFRIWSQRLFYSNLL
jgi:hypothetical protein